MLFKRINAYEVGLVFKGNVYVRMLKEGWNFIKPTETVYVYDMEKEFFALCELSLLLKDEALKEMLYVEEVKDNEIVLVFESNIFKRVLTAGRYAFWKGVVNYSFTRVDLGKIEITEAIDRAVLMRTEVLQYLRVFTVLAVEKGLLFVNNQYVKVLEPGNYFFWKNSIPVTVMGADMRQMQLDISGQEILTKDKAALRINLIAQYRVKDVEKAMIANKDYEKQLYVMLQLALREYIGAYTLDEVLARKESVAGFVMDAVAEKIDALGLEVSACGIRDVILPGEMKEILNQVLIAEKKAQANTIMRREETASTRSLLNTAKLMEENEMLYKLKEMEYVERISEKISSISVNGNTLIVDQLKDIFSPVKK